MQHPPSCGPARLRVVVRPPQPGYCHPAGRRDVLTALRWAGPEAVYGLRSIELASAPEGEREVLPALGQLRVPGRILLYEQPVPPWRLPGILAPGEASRLERAGAVLTVHREAGATVVDWPGETLRDFMLFEVLLHEVGHHILQHHKGKRLARVVRTRDHEAFARRFVDRCRLARKAPACG